MLDAASPEANGIRHRDAGTRAVRDHDESVESEEVPAPVGLRVEARAKPPRARPDEQTAEPATERRAELRAQRVEQRLDRPFERLQRDVPREAVRDDDVRPSLQEQPSLHVPREVEISGSK